jgi:hypothetical protein
MTRTLAALRETLEDLDSAELDDVARMIRGTLEALPPESPAHLEDARQRDLMGAFLVGYDTARTAA